MTQTNLFAAIPDAVRDRIDTALNDPDMSRCALAVLSRLRHLPAAGRNRAISIASLQSYWQICGVKVYSVREIKAAVKELLEERNVPIGSARCNPAGYYLLVCEDDIRAAVKPIWGEITSQLRRVRCLDPKSSISRELCGQLGIQETGN